MKTILTIILILIAIDLYADCTTTIKDNDRWTTTRTHCIDGYKYVSIASTSGISITQMYYQSKHTYHPQPIKCTCPKDSK